MRKAAGLLIAVIMILVLHAAAGADCLGPRRFKIEKVRDPDNDLWTLRHEDPTDGFPEVCSIQAHCDQEPDASAQIEQCGWEADEVFCEPAYIQSEIPLSPAIVSVVSACDVPGENGWCRGGALLQIKASDPLEGEVITHIESNIGVLCDSKDAQDITCLWSEGGQGELPLSVWAVSSYGDTSDPAEAFWRNDTIAPQAEIAVEGGLAGREGWYREGRLNVVAIGEDAESGVAEELISLAGGEWTCALEIGQEGIYQVLSQIKDHAGNQTTSVWAIGLDLTAPSLTTCIEGMPGVNGWHVSNVVARAQGTDALSGIDQAEVELDGVWMKSPTMISEQGEHQVRFRALDVAGNETLSEVISVNVDTELPILNIELSGEKGNEGWFLTPVNINAVATDSASGIDALKMQIDTDGWVHSGHAVLKDGRHELVVIATDKAGNNVDASHNIAVDTIPPDITIRVSGGQKGENGWYVGAPVLVSAEVFDSGSGVGLVEYRDNDGEWQNGDSFKVGSEGKHVITFRAWDVAGNHSIGYSDINIDTQAPVSVFNEVKQGKYIWISGIASINGKSADADSGITGVEISLDEGETWETIANGCPAWIYTWDMRGIPDGKYKLIVRAKDVAGNIEKAVPISLWLDKQPPSIEFSESWIVGENPWLKVEDLGVGLERVEVIIHGGEQGISIYAYRAGESPDVLLWDGRFRNVPAAPGDYPVSVRAWDLLSNMAVRTGVVVATGSPLPIQTPEKIATLTPTAQLPVHPTQSYEVSADPIVIANYSYSLAPIDAIFNSQYSKSILAGSMIFSSIFLLAANVLIQTINRWF